MTALTGAATTFAATSGDTATKYEVTYPNGAVVVFDHEWQAVQAQALSGGSLRKVVPAES